MTVTLVWRICNAEHVLWAGRVHSAPHSLCNDEIQQCDELAPRTNYVTKNLYYRALVGFGCGIRTDFILTFAESDGGGATSVRERQIKSQNRPVPGTADICSDPAPRFPTYISMNQY
jgi:hypothetical protein